MIAGSGTSPTPSMIGFNARAGARRSPARSRSVQHQTTPHTLCMWYSAGNMSTGGTVWKLKNPPSSRGWSPMKSRYQEKISSVRSIGHHIGPATTFVTGTQLNENEVTTPKFPPPPRIAQKSSGSRSASTCTTEPSARTTVAETRWSIVSPYVRVRCPVPPPSVRPPTPVVPMIPTGTASPCAWVAASTSLSSAPPWTRTMRAPGSTVISDICERSMTSPSSTLPSPPPLWPPPRTARRKPRSRANPIAAATSCSSTQ